MAAIVGGLVLAGIADSLLHRLAGFFQIILISLFLSFAIEPAVGYLAKRGWRRGAATGLVFLAVLVVAAGLIALLIPAVVTGTRQLIAVLPDLVHNLARYLSHWGSRSTRPTSNSQVRTYGNRLLAERGPAARRYRAGRHRDPQRRLPGAGDRLVHLLHGRAGAADAPGGPFPVPPGRQRRILFVWERAIEQTGGYFYSRLLLAVINGVLMYAVLRWRGVPFAAPLAVFEGVVSEFIPIVGTYIAGAAPVLVALLYDPVDALIVLIWIVLYQQVENYFLSPRLTAKTMALPAPLAFAAALIGGALGGILFAFLALPTAGVIRCGRAGLRPLLRGRRERQDGRVLAGPAGTSAAPHPSTAEVRPRAAPPARAWGRREGT